MRVRGERLILYMTCSLAVAYTRIPYDCLACLIAPPSHIATCANPVAGAGRAAGRGHAWYAVLLLVCGLCIYRDWVDETRLRLSVCSR
jgi:hypothetical protein